MNNYNVVENIPHMSTEWEHKSHSVQGGCVNITGMKFMKITKQ